MANEKIFRVDSLGRMFPDITVDPTLIPSSGEKLAAAGSYGAPGPSNTYVTSTDPKMLTTDLRNAANGPSGYTPSDTDRYATMLYVQDNINGLDWQNSVTRDVNYIKTTTGAPTGTPADGEVCLNTFDKQLYVASGTVWGAAQALTTGQRFVFMENGTDTTGDSGTYTHNNKIYYYNGTTITEITLTAGGAFLLESDGYHYQYNGTDIVLWSSGMSHNSLSGLQGGEASAYYHVTQAIHDALVNALTGLTSTNPAVSSEDRTGVPIRYTFVKWNGAGQSQVDNPVYSEAGSRLSVIMPKDGYVVGVAVQSSSPRSAGILTAKPSIDGVAETDTAFHAILNSTATTVYFENIAINYFDGTPQFTAGKLLGAMLDTSATWATTAGNETITIDLYVVFETKVGE